MKPRVLFFGTPQFAVPAFQATSRSCDLIGVVTQPDKARGRGHQVSSCEVKLEAQKLGLKCFSPSSLKKKSAELDLFLAFLRSQKWDLFVVTAYGNLLPQEILELPRLGCINLHASLLPKWRGAAPIQRALEAGDKETGVCLQKMVMEMDAGDVLAEESLSIDDEDDAISLSQKLSLVGGRLLEDFLNGLSALGPVNQSLEGQVQDPSKVSFAPKIKKEEALWDESWTATQSFNRIRAFRAWPQVKALCPDGGELKLLKARVVEAKLDPGRVGIDKERVLLGCFRSSENPNALELLSIQAPNRGPMEALAYFKRLSEDSRTGQLPLRLLKVGSQKL